MEITDGAPTSPAATAIATEPVTVSAAADGSVDDVVGATVHVTGGPSAFAGGTNVTFTLYDPVTDQATAGYLIPAARGIEATAPPGTGPNVPLTLTFDVGPAPGPDWLPVSMHQRAGGTWEPIEATSDGAGRVTVVTQDFSIHVPSWLNPSNWFRTLLTAATSFFGGRTTADPCPPAGQPPEPSWAFVTGPITGSAHVCLFDNSDTTGDRVETHLRSNRGSYLVVAPWVRPFEYLAVVSDHRVEVRVVGTAEPAGGAVELA